ncbi:MAG: hypothetical protein IKI11_00685 [Neisseriaceae bacterium]|nr:hypothetical protein [Neisseriaceae bacterium]
MFKTLCTLTLALSLMACSEDVLQPQYDKKTPQTMPDAATLKKHPFLLVSGEWIDHTGGTTVNIDEVGHFIMRHHITNTEDTGYLEYVHSKHGSRYELYRDNKKPMNLAFSVKIEQDKRELLLLDDSTAMPFRLVK